MRRNACDVLSCFSLSNAKSVRTHRFVASRTLPEGSTFRGWKQQSGLCFSPCAGIGEIGLAGIAAAITEPVYHATWVPVRERPVRMENLLVLSMHFLSCQSIIGRPLRSV